MIHRYAEEYRRWETAKHSPRQLHRGSRTVNISRITCCCFKCYMLVFFVISNTATQVFITYSMKLFYKLG
ncbi:hypothetical protein CDAR_224821 [Caerostris darwini]|uniref:Uncharacterized protein n=1 Tax=Caerostris darwini TaxID=1538125 RepID=A0AAV4NCH9_9ARAC|nr:hypothetical protein CDAR_224821 [Caerostris darwini]